MCTHMQILDMDNILVCDILYSASFQYCTQKSHYLACSIQRIGMGLGTRLEKIHGHDNYNIIKLHADVLLFIRHVSDKFI